MVADSVRYHSRLIFESYVNEVCLDYALKEKILANVRQADALPNYKIVSTFFLFKKYGLIIPYTLRLFSIFVIPMLLLISLSLNLILSVLFFVFPFQKNISDLPKEILLPVDNNFKLFRYLYDDFDSRLYFVCKRPATYIMYFSAGDFLKSFQIVVSVLVRIIMFRNTRQVRRKDLVFHVIDLIPISWLSLFIQKLTTEEKTFITDCNLQRWSYLLTHMTTNCSLIQHAYIHKGLQFDYSFGSVSYLYVFDPVFKSDFTDYYQVENIGIIRPTYELATFQSEKKVLFLASSAPFMNFELRFLQFIRHHYDFYIIVKLHPFHIYDASISKLTILADIVIEKDVFPDCDYMVSYDSFLGFEYKSMGKNVHFLKDGKWEDYFTAPPPP